MKATIRVVVMGVLCLVIGLPSALRAEPMGTAFTYQGRLKQGGLPVNDSIDLAFTLWSDPDTLDVDPNDQVGPTLWISNHPVDNGLFTVALDFGGGAFTGEARWLEVAVRVPHDPNDLEPYTTLAPRHRLTPTAYALNVRTPLALTSNGEEPTLSAEHTGLGGVGMHGVSGDGAGVIGQADSGYGVLGVAMTGEGVRGESTFGDGLRGISVLGFGLLGESEAGDGVWGVSHDTNAAGALGHRYDYGVYGESTTGYAGYFEGDVNVNGDMNVTGAAVLGSDLSVFGTTLTEGLWVNGDAGVGSGLTVGGIVESTWGGFKFPDGTMQDTASVAGNVFWNLTGNAGTTPGTHFVGTTDNQPLVLKTNDSEAVRIAADGKVGIGTPDPLGQLHIDTGSQYAGYFISSQSTGRAVYGVASNPSGTNYGIYGQTNSPNGYAGYFEGRGYFRDAIGIGTVSPAASLHAHSTGPQLRLSSAVDEYAELYKGSEGLAISLNGVERVRLSDGGAMGIGTASPDARLHVTTSSQYGGHFVSSSDVGQAVFGEATSAASNFNFGGFFLARGRYGTGVYGFADGANALGVAGAVTGAQGIAVKGIATQGGDPNDPNVHNYGGYFTADGHSARAVYGKFADNDDPNQFNGYGGYFVAETKGGGVLGRGYYGGSFEGEYYGGYFEGVHHAVHGEAPVGVGVYGEGYRGVRGEAYGGSYSYGVMGYAMGEDDFAGYFQGQVAVYGDFNAYWGAKNFVQPHPTDPSKQIVYTTLEGGENGIYVRGSGQLVGGRVEIDLPEHFAWVAAEKGLTAQVTPRDGAARSYLYVEDVSPERLIVAEAGGGSSDASFDWLVMGVRRGFEQHETIQESRYMQSAMDMSQEKFEEWMAQPRNRGTRDLLIGNGSLTSDGKINQETASRLGWKLGPKTEAEWQANRPRPLPRDSDDTR